MRIVSIDDLARMRDSGLKRLKPDRLMFRVGMGTCGIASGAWDVFRATEEKVDAMGLDAVVLKSGCIGFCPGEPLIEVRLPGRPSILMKNMTTAAASEMIEAVAAGRELKEWALCFMPDGAGQGEVSGIPSISDQKFFAKQRRLVLRNCGLIDPDSLVEYVARGGFYALMKALKGMSPDEVIQEVIDSGLRGRGGAGYPTGLKWKVARESKEEEKFVICNADEGDPGVFKDRVILEGDPYSVLEGILITGYAIGSSEGFIYLREEYPRAYQQISQAIGTLRNHGLIGRNIADSDFDFVVHLYKGGRSYVAGEESALMESIEGRIGEPRTRPPFPTRSGLFGRPTNVNNVESLANIPEIIRHGGKWYAGIGTQENKGTKTFCIVGHVSNPGLVEVPFGLPLRSIIEDVAGGVPGKHTLKAIQLGSPFGGFVPADKIDVTLNDTSLAEVGASLGSGGLVVMDDRACIIDRVRFLTNFFYEESCGKCTPCREGLGRILEILDRICSGKAREGDMDLLEELSVVVQDFSFCALGHMAPRPLLSSLRYFNKEYSDHIQGHCCPAMVCKMDPSGGNNDNRQDR